jgi:hypothetical protein
MAFVQNFPFFSIILTIFSGPLSTMLSNKKAKIWNMILIGIVCALNIAVLAFVISTGESIDGLVHLVEKAGGIVYKKLFVLAEGDSKNRTDIEYLATIPLL